MVAILEKGEFNSDFYPMVDFIVASPLRYALTVKPTILVSHIRQFWSTARIETTDEGTNILATVDDEPASPVRDVSEGEACLTESGFIADRDRATIAKSSTLPHDSAPRVTSPAADEGKVEILKLKERVQVLEDREGVAAKHSRDDAPIKERSINEREAANERISNDSEDVARVLTSMDAATVLAEGIDVPTSSGSIPTAGPLATIISTGSEVGPTTSPIVTRKKGKEVMVESDTPKKKKLQEQIDAQVARELKEQQEKEDMRMNEQIARDAEVARIHAEEELQGMIDSLDKSNETIAKYLQEYQDFALELSLEKRIELIIDLVKYQDNYSKGEGSGTPSEPHHTPFPEVETSHPTTSLIPLPSIPTTPISPVTQPVTTPIIQYSRRARIAQSFALPTVVDEPASPVRDVSEGEACPTESGFIADQDRATIVKSSTLPHDSAPRVTSPAADEGNMVNVLEDREGVAAKQSGYDTPIKGRSINEGEAAAERIIARELEEQQEKEDMRMNEQIARDAEVARIHVAEELQGMIDSLDQSNETVAKYLQEYQDFASELPLEKRIELISDLAQRRKLKG
nr:hypothetical protein [Tanacetum cinerariifolium]